MFSKTFICLGGQIQIPGSWSRGAYYAYNIMDVSFVVLSVENCAGKQYFPNIQVFFGLKSRF